VTISLSDMPLTRDGSQPRGFMAWVIVTLFVALCCTVERRGSSLRRGMIGREEPIDSAGKVLPAKHRFSSLPENFS
jgi:hypothetical protein